MYKSILKEIKKFNKIIIIRHKAPDYDAYGSQVGLYYSLKEKYKDKEIYIDGEENNANIFNIKFDKLSEADYKGALVIITDTSNLLMLENDYVLNAKKVIILDHHNNVPDIKSLSVIKSNYSSASELITEFIYETKLPLNNLCANLLLSGIIGDSNRFLYKGTSSNTFKMAQILVNAGADLLNIYDRMKKEDPESEKRFKGYVLSNFKIDNNIAYIYTTNEIIKEYGVSPLFASRGCINLLSDIKGVKAFFSLTEDGRDTYLEIRSKDKSVVSVAKYYGGGGHELACGATFNSLPDVNEIIEKIGECVNE